VGASGDLAPLAHLALGMMGEGKMWSFETGWGEAKYVSAIIKQIFCTIVYAQQSFPLHLCHMFFLV